ncbi:MAG: transglutaminase family protein [Deltaproteobacteria bacterium]|nr:transglutaminase family protein [Deltaproteobacteria bacterium]
METRTTNSAADRSAQTWLAPGRFVDCDSEVVRAFAARVVAGADTPCEKAVRLYYAVRDGLRYDPYACVFDPAAFMASAISSMSGAFCVQKAILMTAACRAQAIPCRLGFADVRNHLASPKLLERMGTDLFVFHGYCELFLEGRWVKATPTFNRELCERFGVKPLEFDGTADALFHEFDQRGRRHMEYVRYHGVFADLPFERMVAAMHEAYANFGREGEPGDAAGDQAFAAKA